MFEALAIIACMFLGVLGLSEILHGIRLRFLRPKRCGKTVVVTVLEEPSATAQLNMVLEQSRWLGGSYSDYVIAAGKDLQSKTRESCEKIAAHNYNVIYCDYNMILHIINGLYEENDDTTGNTDSDA